MNKKIIFIGLAALAVLAFLFQYKNPVADQVVNEVETKILKDQAATQDQNVTSFKDANPSDLSSEVKSIKSEDLKKEEVLTHEALQGFIDTEAIKIEEPVSGTVNFEEKYQQISSRMSTQQIQEVQNQVLNNNEDIKKRIVSAYLLMKDNSALSLESLEFVLAQSDKLSSPVNFKPHSLDEILAKQNSAIFNMIAEEWMQRQILGKSDVKQATQDLMIKTSDLKLKAFLKARLKQM